MTKGCPKDLICSCILKFLVSKYGSEILKPMNWEGGILTSYLVQRMLPDAEDDSRCRGCCCSWNHMLSDGNKILHFILCPGKG